MITRPDDKLTRIGIFYDGGYFNEVSDYYRYFHDRKMRLSIGGIHNFVSQKVSEVEKVDQKYCHVVDAHYFRGRFSTAEAEAKGKILGDRKFDEMLMRAGVVMHYLPRTARGEKGIDVWLALEAFELAIYKRFNVLVLVVCDGDFLPLIRKVNTLGTRVMVLGWDFEYIDTYGEGRTTTTSVSLLDEATYPIMMHTLIDDKTLRNDPLVNGLFLPRMPKEEKPGIAAKTGPIGVNSGQRRTGKITRVDKEKGYGFLTDSTEVKTTWFFHKSEIVGFAFEALKEGDSVEYQIGDNPLGKDKPPVALKIKKT